MSVAQIRCRHTVTNEIAWFTQQALDDVYTSLGWVADPGLPDPPSALIVPTFVSWLNNGVWDASIDYPKNALVIDGDHLWLAPTTILAGGSHPAEPVWRQITTTGSALPGGGSVGNALVNTGPGAGTWHALIASDVGAAAAAGSTTPEEHGAVGDGQIVTATTTHAASTALAWPTNVFAPGDVGKPLVLTEGGTQASTGPVTSVPVTAAGTGYTSMPTASLSGGGSGAVLQPAVKVVSATVAAGGSGYTNGTYDLTVNTAFGTVAVLNVTVSGGAVTAVNSITAAGSFTVMPTLAGIGHVFLPAAGGSNATFNLTMGVDQVVICNCGSGYTPGSTTASLSGGGGSGATLGTVVVTPNIPALVTSIAGYVDARHVTLANPIGNTATRFRQLSWCTDDSIGLGAALGSGAKVVCDGSKIYGHTVHLALRDDGTNQQLVGNGRPRLVAMAAMNEQIYKGTVNGLCSVEGFILEGNTLVTHNINLAGSHATGIDRVNANNCAPGGSNIILGNSSFSSTSYENVIGDKVRCSNNIGYSSAKDLPTFCIENYGSDNHIGKVKLANAYQACIYNGGSDNHHNAPHGFGFPTNLAPQFIFQDNGQGTWINPICDTWAPKGAGFYRSASSTQPPSVVQGAQYEFQGQPTNGTNCLRIAASAKIVAQGATVPTGQQSGFGAFQASDIISQTAPRSNWTVLSGYPSAIYEAGIGVASTTTTATNSAGAFALGSHDTSTAGGNSLGPGAVDLSVTRSNPAQVASGTGSAVIGTSVTASGSNAVAIGINSSASGAVSHARGSNATDRGSNSKDVWASARFSAAGDQQEAKTIFYAATSSTSAARLTTSGGGAGAFEVGALAPNSMWVIRGFLLGRKSDGTTVVFKLTEIPIKIGATGGTAAFDGTPAWTLIGSNSASVATPSLTIDTTHGAPNFTITPPDSGSWHWTMTMYSSEIG